MVARTVPLQDIARHFSVSKPSGHQETGTRKYWNFLARSFHRGSQFETMTRKYHRSS
jgi:hypothetical protein